MVIMLAIEIRRSLFWSQIPYRTETVSNPLLATLIAWGRTGIVDRIDRAMSMANHLADKLSKEESISLWAMPKTGVTVFRPLKCDTEDFHI